MIPAPSLRAPLRLPPELAVVNTVAFGLLAALRDHRRCRPRCRLYMLLDALDPAAGAGELVCPKKGH